MAKRRPKGTGSVQKYGKRQWRAVMPPLPDGSKPSRIFDKQADAIEWLDEQIGLVKADKYVPPSDQTLGGWLPEFIAAYRTDLAPKTMELDQDSIKRIARYTPDLLMVALQDLTEPEIQRAVNQMRENVEPRTVEMTLGLVRQSLNKAVDLKMISSNPAKKIKIAKSNKVSRDKYIEPDTLQSIVDYCLTSNTNPRSHVYQDIIYLISQTGMRTGEARAITGSQLRPGGIRIDQAFDKYGNLKTTKNKKNRFITLAPDLLAMLKDRTEHSISGYAFETSTGKPLGHRNIHRHLSVVTDGQHAPHDLRHTFITNAIRNGANPKAVADYVGDTVETILRVYVHTNHADLQHVAMMGTKRNKVTELKRPAT